MTAAGCRCQRPRTPTPALYFFFFFFKVGEPRFLARRGARTRSRGEDRGTRSGPRLLAVGSISGRVTGPSNFGASWATPNSRCPGTEATRPCFQGKQRKLRAMRHARRTQGARGGPSRGRGRLPHGCETRCRSASAVHGAEAGGDGDGSARFSRRINCASKDATLHKDSAANWPALIEPVPFWERALGTRSPMTEAHLGAALPR